MFRCGQCDIWVIREASNVADRLLAGVSARQTVLMATVITVQADTREECAATLDRLCVDYGWVPRLPPVRSGGTDRWIARATAAPDLVVEGRAGR